MVVAQSSLVKFSHSFSFRIACGALSGFHSLISSGTTPKLIKNEKDILPIGFGAMLLEAFVGTMALLAATVMPTADYFAINSLPEVFAKLHMIPVDLGSLSSMVGEDLAGRPGGSVSLAAGMTYVFQSVSWLKPLMGYWYHFCIMFEALFILTTIDSGTRIGRYLLSDLFHQSNKKYSKQRTWFNAIFFSALISFSWGYLLYSGNIVDYLAFVWNSQSDAGCNCLCHWNDVSAPFKEDEICLGNRSPDDFYYDNHLIGCHTEYYTELLASETLHSFYHFCNTCGFGLFGAY